MPYLLSYEYGLISVCADSAILLQLASSEIACTLMRTVARDVIVYKLKHGTCVPEDACVVPAPMCLQSWSCLVASRRLLRSQGRAGFLNVVLEHKSQTVDAPAPQHLLYVLLELRFFVTGDRSNLRCDSRCMLLALTRLRTAAVPAQSSHIRFASRARMQMVSGTDSSDFSASRMQRLLIDQSA